MGIASVWHGDKAELDALLLAISHNCTCQGRPSGPACPAHAALLEQRWIDGLIFVRYLAERLLREEFR